MVPPLRFTLEAMSPRAEELVDRRFADVALGRERWIDSVVADEKPAYRAFLDSLIERPRVAEIRVHRVVRGEVRTLRERYDAAVWREGRWVFQGIIEDAREDRPRNITGDRALEVLKDLRETMKFLDAEASSAPTLNGDLSVREREVYQLIRSGISNALIAVRLGCAESTVKKHVSAIFDKMGVHTRAQLLTLE
jgi:DNA-binding CsgD family transcriptional regulator